LDGDLGAKPPSKSEYFRLLLKRVYHDSDY